MDLRIWGKAGIKVRMYTISIPRFFWNVILAKSPINFVISLMVSINCFPNYTLRNCLIIFKAVSGICKCLAISIFLGYGVLLFIRTWMMVFMAIWNDCRFYLTRIKSLKLVPSICNRHYKNLPSDLSCWAPFYSFAKDKYLFQMASLLPCIVERPVAVYFLGDTSLVFFY